MLAKFRIYVNLEESLIHDHMVLWISDNACRKCLPQEEKLSMDACILIFNSYEKTNLQLTKITGEEEPVHRISVTQKKLLNEEKRGQKTSGCVCCFFVREQYCKEDYSALTQ